MAQAKSAAAAETAAREPAAPAAASAEPERTMEYKPDPRVALPEAGPVALGNWVGRVGDRRVRVYRGAIAKAIPEAVQKAMAKSGIPIGTITWQELGLPPRAPGAAPPPSPQRRIASPPSEAGGGF